MLPRADETHRGKLRKDYKFWSFEKANLSEKQKENFRRKPYDFGKDGTKCETTTKAITK